MPGPVSPAEGPRPDTAAVVGPAIQDLAVRRLGRAFVWLAFLAIMGFAELLFRGHPYLPAAVVAAGAPVSALALLLVGQRGVRWAFGRPDRGPWTMAGAVWLVPWAYGAYMLVFRGLFRLARPTTGGGAGAMLLAAAYGLLGVRVLLDVGRISEVVRLARSMSDGTPDAEAGR